LAAAKSVAARLLAQVEELTGQLKVKDGEAQASSAETAKLRSLLDDVTNQLRQRTAEHENRSATIEKREADLAAARADCERLQAEIALLRPQLQQKQAEIGASQGETSQWRRKADEAAGQLVERASALQQKDAELAAAKAETARLQGIVRKVLEANRREKKDMHYNTGCVFRAGKMFEKAEGEFLKALEIDPEDAAIHYNLGILYEEDLKNTKKARTHYERFLKLAPDDPDAPKVQEWVTSLP
jgi:tetratricopeptide (TPR) repeat protein